MRVAPLQRAKRVCDELGRLADAFDAKATQYAEVVKPGRTHLQDAVPVTFGQEIGGWATRVRGASARLRAGRAELCELGIGGIPPGARLQPSARAPAPRCALPLATTVAPLMPPEGLFAALP